MAPVHASILKKPSPSHPFTNSALIMSRIVDPKFVEIVFTSFSYAPYIVLPSINNIFYMHDIFSWFFIKFSLWTCRSLCEPQKNSYNFHFTCLSSNSLVSWITAKLVYVCPIPVIPFSAWSKHLNAFEKGRLIHSRHNLDPRQMIMICISFTIRFYIDVSHFKKIVGLNFSKLSFKVAYRISSINTPGVLLFSCLKSKLYVPK